MLATISYWSLPGGLEGTLEIEKALDLTKAAGYQGLELAVAETGVLTPSTDQATCEKYRDLGAKKGIALETLASGMSWGCSPTHLNPEVRAKSLELHAGALQRAAWLGAKSMLFVPGAVKVPWDPNYKMVPYEKASAWAREGVATLAKTAEKVNVELCVENVWNGLFYSPLELASVVDDVKSAKVGIYFDVGNVLGYHQCPVHWIKFLGKRIKRVHIKDFKTSVGNMSGFCDLLEGDVPWKDTMAALKEIGYDKTLVAEMIPPAPGLLERTRAALTKIMAM